MNALMLDIETCSTAPTARVLQLGFTAANLRTGEILVPPLNMWLGEQSGGTTDSATLAWWEEQKPEVREDVWNLWGAHPTHTPAESFEVLQQIYASMGPDATVWGSPAMFDLPILTHMWGNKKPWPYYQERCLMTLYKMLDPDKQHKPANPAEHDAASDAKAQMEHLLAIFKHNPVLQGAK